MDVILSTIRIPEADTEEERRCNYERYRILVQNDVAGGILCNCLSGSFKSLSYMYSSLLCVFVCVCDKHL